MTTHIIPINDLEPHDESSTCKCGPTVDILENGDMLIIHNSFDGREVLDELFSNINNN